MAVRFRRCASSLFPACFRVALRLTLGLALVGITGCSPVDVHLLTTDHYPPTPKDKPIKLFEGKVLRPYREIAYIDSQALAEQNGANQEKQLLQIQEAARKLGADAVHNIQYLTEKVQGLVVDQNVPFTAYKQGRFKLYFIRGTAIVYTAKSVESEAPPPSPGSETKTKERLTEPEPTATPVLAPLVEDTSPSP